MGMLKRAMLKCGLGHARETDLESAREKTSAGEESCVEEDYPEPTKTQIMPYLSKHFKNVGFLLAAMLDTESYIVGQRATEFFFPPEKPSEEPWIFVCNGHNEARGAMIAALAFSGVEWDCSFTRHLGFIMSGGEGDKFVLSRADYRHEHDYTRMNMMYSPVVDDDMKELLQFYPSMTYSMDKGSEFGSIVFTKKDGMILHSISQAPCPGVDPEWSMEGQPRMSHCQVNTVNGIKKVRGTVMINGVKQGVELRVFGRRSPALRPTLMMHSIPRASQMCAISAVGAMHMYYSLVKEGRDFNFDEDIEVSKWDWPTAQSRERYIRDKDSRVVEFVDLPQCIVDADEREYGGKYLNYLRHVMKNQSWSIRSYSFVVPGYCPNKECGFMKTCKPCTPPRELPTWFADREHRTGAPMMCRMIVSGSIRPATSATTAACAFDKPRALCHIYSSYMLS